MVSFLLPSRANFLGLQSVYFPFRSNFRLSKRMWWVEMKGWRFSPFGDGDNQKEDPHFVHSTMSLTQEAEGGEGVGGNAERSSCD